MNWGGLMKLNSKEALKRLNKAIHTMTFCGVGDRYPLESGMISKQEHKNMIDVMKNNDKHVAIIEKELKALETIKDLNLFGVEEDENGLCWLVYLGQGIGITKEQYDLLKGVLQ